MTSYLVDAVLLATSWRVGLVYRELKRLRSLQGQYQSAINASVQALEKVRGVIEALRLEAGAKPADEMLFKPAASRNASSRNASAPSVFVPFGATQAARPVQTAASR